MEGAGDRPLRHEPGPQFEDGAHDLLVGTGAEARDGDGPSRVDYRALRTEVAGDGPVEAGVQRDVREEGLRPSDHAREGRAEAGVQEAGHRRSGLREVVVDLVAVDAHLHLDRNQALAVGGVEVDVVDRLPLAVGQLGDTRPRQALDVVLHLVERRHDGVLAVLVGEPDDLALAHAGGLGLGAHVTHVGGGGSGVGDDELRDVLTELTLVPELHRDHPEALAEVLSRIDVEGSRHGATHVGPVPHGHGEGDQLTLREDRPHDANVVEVGAARVGVIDAEDVSGMDVVLEPGEDRLSAEVQGADVDGDVLAALHDGVALGVDERAGEVARIDDERVARAQDLRAHQVDARGEGVLQDLEGHRVEMARSRSSFDRGSHSDTSRMWMRMFQFLSISHRVRGGTTVVESSWSMIAGPFAVTPGASSERSYTGVATGRPVPSSVSNHTSRTSLGAGGSATTTLPLASVGLGVTPMARRPNW